MAKIDGAGRIVIPAEYRKALGVKPGDQLVVLLEEEELRLFTPLHAVQRARSLVQHFVPPERDLSAALIRRRRSTRDV